MNQREFINWGRVVKIECYLAKCQEKIKNCINSCTTTPQLGVTLEWMYKVYDYNNISRILDCHKITNWRDRNYILDIAEKYQKEIFALYNTQYDAIHSKHCTDVINTTTDLVKLSKNFADVLNYINNVYEKVPNAFDKCSQQSLATLFIEIIKKI